MRPSAKWATGWRSRKILKRFRWRFILITLALVGAVSLLIFGFIGVTNQQSEKAQINEALEASADNAGPGGLWGFGIGRDGSRRRDEQNNSTPVYVGVMLSGDFYAGSSNTLRIDSDYAEEAACAALERDANSGELEDYGLFYKVSYTMTGARVAFADANAYYESIFEFYLRLAVMWLALMAAVFAITVFLARLVTKPVQQAWDTQQQFIADASHELKTPLTVIMADASILASSPEKTVREQQQWVEGISAEAERMQELTEGMLTLAQADAGVDTSQLMSELDLSELVQASLLQFEAVAFERGLMIEDIIEEHLTVNGDRLRLEGLLKTLLENACKYSPKPGTIDVSLRRVKNRAELAVHNAGDPIPPEDLPHLFDRFYRSDKSRVREGETASFGLGLSIAKSTAEMHGGTISAQSGDGGTTFTVVLPLS